ncbi:MAG: IPT/TIG domain-containing protein [Acidobacteria bacterium]|nr:IPT/TIG domain-containing protein [Acidobacteriota bacterium]MBI3424770.1 IPT/TIG domain-containing protein [Acidobacteriota bacterium]
MKLRNQFSSKSVLTSRAQLHVVQFGALVCVNLLLFSGLSFIGNARGFSAPFQTPAAFSSLSAASFETNLTPEGIAAGFGSNLAPSTASATTTPLPTTLNTISVTVNGVNAGLFFVSSGQINYLIPAGTAAGEATVNVLRSGVITHTGKVTIVSAAPAIFTANSNGTGVPAAIVLRVATNGAQTTETIAQLVSNRWQTKAINLGPTGERVFLILFLCGIRGLPNSDGNSGNGVAENVRVLIGGIEQTPIFANKQGGLVGVDQINVEIPRELLGRGKIKTAVIGGGLSSLEVEIEIAGATGTNPPTVTSFAPTLATASETLNINGVGFSTVAANNLVRVNGLETSVESAAATQLIVRVPYGAEAGRVIVRTTTGEGSSNSDVSVRTTISGLTTDTNGNPLPGVEVSYGAFKTTTRNDGTYLLRDVPAGFGTLKIDPSKLSLTPAMQPYSKIATATANRDNLQTTTALQTVSGEAASIQTQGSGAAEEGDFTQHRLLAPNGTITTGNVTFSFDDNTVGTFPAGVTDGRIYLTVLTNSRTPTPLPAGIFSSTIAQLSPIGVKLAPGGKLTFPNTDGLAANAQARLYKLDQTAGSPTLGQFVDVGVATVSADGQRVETGANAITETSIYFAALARPLTTVTGRVVDSDNTTPVRRALVTLRGQQTFTDGNGSFTLRNIPVPANNLLNIEASFVRPTGRTDSVTRNNIAVGANGLTHITPDLVLPSPTTQPNRPPSLIAPTLLTATEGQTRNIPLVVSDPDSDQPVQLVLTSPNFVTLVLIQNIANIRIAPPAGSAGTYPLTLKATDNQNAVTTLNASLTVTGNRAPVLSVPLAQTASVGQQLAFNVSASDPDADQTVTLMATSLPSGASFVQTSATTGRFTWTPTANQTGLATATFTATDNGSPVMTDRKSVAINVGGAITQWAQTAGPEGAVIRVLLVSGNNFFAGTDGGVFRSANDGASWTPANNGLAGQFVSALTTNGTALFAGTYGTSLLGGAGIFRSTDNGANWTPASNGLSTPNVFALGASGTTVFAGLVSGGIARTTDNGANWAATGAGLSQQLVYAFAALGSNVFAGTLTGGVFRSTDNGTNWTAVNTGLTFPSISSFAVINTTLFAGTNGGGVFRSTDNGANWTAVNAGLGIQAISSLAVSGTTLYAGSQVGGVFRSTDNGANWSAVNNGLANQFINALAARGTAVVAGANSGALRSADSGANWAAANTGLSGQFIFALAVNGANLFASTYSGVFRTTNNGAAWTLVNNGLGNRIILSLLVTGTTLYAGSEGDGVFRTTDNGANWTPANNGLLDRAITGLAMSGNTLFAATAGSGIYRSTDNGATWTGANTGLGSLNILSIVASGSTVFVGTDQAGVFRSTDGGNNWAAVNTGLSSLTAYSLGLNGTTLFVGTPTGLFRSSDNGATWTAANTGLTGVLVSSFAASGQNLFVGSAFGGVFRSINNGGLWTPFNEGLPNLFVKALVVSGNSLAAGNIGSSVFTRPLP